MMKARSKLYITKRKAWKRRVIMQRLLARISEVNKRQRRFEQALNISNMVIAAAQYAINTHANPKP